MNGPTVEEKFTDKLRLLLLATRGSEPTNNIVEVEIGGNQLYVVEAPVDDPSDRSVENDGQAYILTITTPG